MAAVGHRIEKVGGGFLSPGRCQARGLFQSPAVSARQWWWSLFPAAGEAVGCPWIQSEPPHQQELGTGHSLCVPKPAAKHWLCPFALWSVRLWEVPGTANSPPGKALSVVKGPLPLPASPEPPAPAVCPGQLPVHLCGSCHLPAHQQLCGVVSRVSLGMWELLEPKGSRVLHGTFMEWGPCARESEQDQHGTCQAKLRQTVGDVPAFPWVFSFRKLPMDS